MTPTERLVALYGQLGNVRREIVTLEEQLLSEQEARRKARELAEYVAHRRSKATDLCGTDSGYYRHRRKFREEACPACKVAHTMAERARARRRSEAVA